MTKAELTIKKKNEILKKVLKKTNKYFEEVFRAEEKNELNELLENEIKNI